MFDAPIRRPRPNLSRLQATTPALLRAAVAATVLLALGAAALALWAAASIAGTAQTVGHDAEPSVALALRLEANLSDMNADALAATLGGQGAEPSPRFAALQSQLASDLVEAARNITYGEAEAAPLRALQRAVFAYLQAVTQQRAAAPADGARRAEAAADIETAAAFPQAQALAKANADVLEARYATYRSVSLLLGGAALAAFALLVAALIAGQLWLARRTRRILNPPLVAATVVAGAAGLWFGTVVFAERADLRAAKQDCYDSLHVLFESKVALNALRAGMSTWLLDPAARPAAAAGMEGAVQSLVGPALDTPTKQAAALAALAAAQERERNNDVAGALAAAPHLGGTLGAELDNVTFGPAERDPASETITSLLRATATIAALQRLDAANHPEAVARWLGARPGDGTPPFTEGSAAIDRTVAVNQSEFDRRVASALGTARLLPPVAVAALLLSVLLATGGLWQRLREYR